MRRIVSLSLVITGLWTSVASASQYSTAVLGLNPVGYWQLDGNTNDSTINAQTGVWTNGGSAYVNGPRPSDGFAGMSATNQAGDFNDARFVQISDFPAYQFEYTNPFTMLAWIKSTNTTANKFIMAKEQNSSNFRGYYMILANQSGASGDIESYRQNTGSNIAEIRSTAPDVNDGLWHMIAARTTGGTSASTMSISIDGAPVTSTTISNTLTSTILASVPLTIGARDTTGGVPFLGQIDEATLFNYALSDSQIAALYLAATVVAPIPEPTSWLLISLGAAGLAWQVRRRR